MDIRKKSIIKKFFSYYKPYKWLFAATLLMAGVGTAASLLMPLLTGYITGTVLEGGVSDALPAIWKTGGLMLLLLLADQGSFYFVDYRGHSMGAMIERDMRRELFDHYQKLPVSFYDNERVGRLMSRLTGDLWSLGELYHHGPEDVILYFIRFIGAFVILLTINIPLTLWVALLLPIGGVLASILGKRMNRAVSRSQQQLSEVNAQAEDSLAGIRVVKSFTGEQMEREKFHRQNELFMKSRVAIYKGEADFYIVLDTLTQLAVILIVVLGGVSILGGQMGLPDLVTFLLYAGYLTDPVKALLHTIGQYQEGIACFKRFVGMLAVSPEPQDAPDALSPQLKGGITFQNVSFRYSDAQGDVLKNISVEIKPGEYAALVGPSGVGKTTFCSLIPRFYDPTAGEILFDGIPAGKISMAALRSQIGMVQQDVYLFAGSVRENIRYGRPDASDEEVAEAARQANAHDFIEQLPNGYDTDVGERGVKLSGGQKQRISIARAFLKNPPILILDEATSALDSESEQQIKEALEALAKSRTTLVIAHRRSTIENASRTLMLQDGAADRAKLSVLKIKLSTGGAELFRHRPLFFANREVKKMTTYYLKQLDETAIPAAETLFARVFEQPPWCDDWSDKQQLRSYMYDLMGQSNSLTFGLYEGEELVGLSMGRIKHWYSGTEYYIDELCICTEKQGQGLGTLFVREIERACKEQGLTHLFLLTESDVPAYKFYKKQGFCEVETNVGFVKKL